MDVGKLIGAITFASLFVSCFFLCNLVIDDQYHIEPTSRPRFTALLILHVVIMVYMLIFLRMETLEEHLRTGLCLAFNITAGITFA
jgi:hypothetical protein